MSTETKNEREFEQHLTEVVYETPFKELNGTTEHLPKQYAALERAWKNRDFEIDKYWSRATYFWAFIAATFAGFIAVCNADHIGENLKIDLRLLINSMGIIFSWAWVLVNLGSKKWQKNWEKHIDMLENEVTGPLYKTVLRENGYSVSRINILVSKFVFAIWSLILLGQVIELFGPILEPVWKFLVSLPHWLFAITIAIATIIFGLYMWDECRTDCEHGKGEPYSFNRRPIQYDEPSPANEESSKENAGKS